MVKSSIVTRATYRLDEVARSICTSSSELDPNQPAILDVGHLAMSFELKKYETATVEAKVVD
jgi:hypothetical protein